MDPAKEPAVGEVADRPTAGEEKSDQQPKDLVPSSDPPLSTIPQDSSSSKNISSNNKDVENPPKEAATTTEEQNLSTGGAEGDWTNTSTSNMTDIPQDDFDGELVDHLLDRPKTPIRQYLIDAIGEKDVCELEAVGDKADETDDEFRQECAVLSETNTDFIHRGLVHDNKHNDQNKGEGTKWSERRLQSPTRSGYVNVVNAAAAAAAGDKTKQMSGAASNKKGTGENNPKKTQRGGKQQVSHEERLRLGVERIQQSNNYWKEEPVEDPRMAGWCIHVCKRPSGHLDKYWFTSTGIRFRSKPEVEKFFRALEEANGDEDRASEIMSGIKKRRSVESSAKQGTVATDAAPSSKPAKRNKTKTTEAKSLSQRQTVNATISSSRNVNNKSNNAQPPSETTVTTPTRSSTRKRTTTTTAVTMEDGIDYSMTNAVQSASASKKRNIKKKERTTKHVSVAKDAKRVRSAAVSAALQQRSNIRSDTTVVEQQGQGTVVNITGTTSQSILYERIKRLKNSNFAVPYRLSFQNGNIAGQYAEPKFIEVKKSAKKKAAKGMQAFSPVSKLDIPAVAESK
mmetsp:Transcript_17067/g.32286  ORF Transcript_17067/g.32286 Transcript_17067/m.32286 type:complete len:568 (+) Transcript_17067:1270-2973(+)